ncbi:MAG: DinB family protein [Candidatus Sumerlaeia bacterium]|nr:DinB family protein [Candidatus Sumerlaeia bacterium]
MISGDPKVELRHLGGAYRRLDEISRWEDHRLYHVEEEVSLWSPAQHVEHMALVNIASFHGVRALIEDDDKNADILRRGRPRFVVIPMFLLGFIPRGKGKAPEVYFPAPDVDREAVRKNIAESRSGMSWVAQNIHHLGVARGRLAHPILGALNARQWLRFIRIHTTHHLRIIDEIDAARLNKE